ncbi:N-acetylmuramoyl-L-alanine amidase [Anaerosacchariphilus polymeriproducens]|uniref:N-acetylmuramoyl-L-alanine amidase n=2 Tax=Anaerosacchariphilus polymeriproducens TaxID=1812858 RepID=A0A371AYS2_9FIRM|nr:N-acetylmuramoyl-L-alanine amidase [Anaerosacchariphilus polymeriproducens]
MGILMILCMSLMVKPGMKIVAKLKGEESQKLTIVVDAGHGGKDPGKVGVNGALEKDINLSIARKLKACFEEEDIEVVLTRKDDMGLYQENTRNKKVEDMQNRCKIINKTKPAITISLHQNSYQEPSVCGPQVFFHGQSKEGEELANVIQDTLIHELKPSKERSAKANESYYLLTKTGVPTVIVECGFLSNKQEADLLIAEDYQQKMAAAICLGVMEYLDSK